MQHKVRQPATGGSTSCPMQGPTQCRYQAGTHMQPSGSFSFCPLNQASPVSVMTAEWEVSMPCNPLPCLSQNAASWFSFDWTSKGGSA